MRVKLISEGKEVDKRYLGVRLLWRSDGVIKELDTDIEVKKVNGVYIIYVGAFLVNPEKITAFKLDEKEKFELKVEKFSRTQLRTRLKISSNELGITEYLGMENTSQKYFTKLKLYEF